MKGKDIAKIILKLALIVGIFVSVYFLAKHLLEVNGLSMEIVISDMRLKFGDNIWFWAIISVLQIIQVVFLPISNQIITIPMIALFPNDLWKVFLASWIGIEIGTIILYFIGRYGGEKILNWLLGDKEKTEKCKRFMNRGKAFYCIGMLVAIIPDDILTTLAGTSKYKFSYVLVVSSITRAICVCASVWGFGYLTRFWWGWVILGIGVILIGLTTYLLFKRQRKLERIENENTKEN